MVACFLAGELTSARFGNGVRAALAQTGRSEALLTEPDLCDKAANRVRRGLLAVTRGYGEDRELFEHFPSRVRWIRARLTGPELAEVRYIDYSYWIEITGASARVCARGRSPTIAFSKPPLRWPGERGLRR
jgi:hypothetical protein